jgi:hypothetical protein
VRKTRGLEPTESARRSSGQSNAYIRGHGSRFDTGRRSGKSVPVKRHVSVLVLGFVAALAVALVAVADTGKGERRQFNAADQAAARSATLRRTDLGQGAWQGGAVKPDLAPPPSCPGYPVDLSRFVLTGAAETRWTQAPFVIDSQAQVLQTAQMVRQEWRIQVQAAGAIPCLRTQLAKEFAAQGAQVVSFKRVPFPQVAPYSTEFRVGASAQGVRVVVEVVLVGRGRTEATLTVLGPAAQQSAALAAAVRYARIVAGRIKAEAPQRGPPETETLAAA